MDTLANTAQIKGGTLVQAEAESGPPNLSPLEASAYLERKWGIRRAVPTLAKIRCVSSAGPVFIRSNRAILYPRDGLDDFARSILSKPMRSTSDAVAA